MVQKIMSINNKIFNIGFSIILLGFTVFLFKTVVFDNNLYAEYQDENKVYDYYRLSANDTLETEIVVANEWMELKKSEIYIADLKTVSEEDCLYVLRGEDRQKIRFSDLAGYTTVEIAPAKKINAKRSKNEERETIEVAVVCAEDSWIRIGCNQDKSLAVKKTYDVCQLSENEKQVYDVFAALLWGCSVGFVILLVWFPKIPSLVCFSFTALILFLAIAVRDVSFLFSPEPFAEQIGTHFYFGTHTGLLQSIFTKEAGYIHFIKRVFAWLVVQSKWGGINYVLITNFFTLLVQAMGCALFMLVPKEREERVLAYVAILYIPMVLLNNVSNFFYIDIGYWGIFYLLFFMFFYNLESISKVKYGIILFIVVSFCLTQGHFVCFIPLASLVAVSKRGRKRVLCGGIVIASLVQLCLTLTTQTGRNWRKDIEVEELCAGIFHEIPKVFYRIWGVNLWGQCGQEMRSFLIVLAYAVLFALIIIAVKRYKSNEVYWETVIGSIILGVTSVVFLGITAPYFLEVGRYDKGRYEMFAIVAFYMCFVLLIMGASKKIGREYSVTGRRMGWILLVLMCSHGVSEEINNNKYEKRYIQDFLCDWRNISRYVQGHENYYIRINPENWSFSAYYKNVSEEIIETTGEKKEISGSTPLVSVYLTRTDLSEPLGIRVYGKGNNLLVEKEQTTSAVRKFTGFLFEKPVWGAECFELYSISTGKPVALQEEMYVYTVGTDDSVPPMG